jgi:hypothetical protein
MGASAGLPLEQQQLSVLRIDVKVSGGLIGQLDTHNRLRAIQRILAMAEVAPAQFILTRHTHHGRWRIHCHGMCPIPAAILPAPATMTTAQQLNHRFSMGSCPNR